MEMRQLAGLQEAGQLPHHLLEACAVPLFSDPAYVLLPSISF
jgi:hypothetical protein